MFHCRSVSHHRTPLAIRECLSLTPAQQAAWLDRQSGIEAVIVSTCNRLELYAYIPADNSINFLWNGLLSQCQVSADDVAPYVEDSTGLEAAEHLFRVGCGLESMALGESQILGQVAQAHELAQAHNTLGAALSLLFRSALHAAKRSQSETTIGSGSASISSLGIARAEEACGSLRDRNILVLGSGEMGEAVVKSLVHRGIRRITVLSRTFVNARRLADLYQAEVRPFSNLNEALAGADVVFTTSGAPFTILGYEDVAPIMWARPDRPLCIIDIAVPRDVDPAVANIPQVGLHNLDDLQHVIEEYSQERQANIPAVERIITEELGRFWVDYQARAVVPVIRSLREHAEFLRRSELEWAYKRLPPESEHERSLLEQFSHRYMNKLLHHLTHNLKTKAGQEDSDLVLAVARELFGLEDTA